MRARVELSNKIIHTLSKKGEAQKRFCRAGKVRYEIQSQRQVSKLKEEIDACHVTIIIITIIYIALFQRFPQSTLHK